MKTVKHKCHTKYRDWYPLRDRGFRYYFRSLALDLLSFRHSEQSLLALNTPHVQFLYIHHVFEDEVEELRKLLRTLSSTYEFVSYSNAVERVRDGNVDRPYMAFSSDDGFKNNIAAARVFSEFNISACFFLNPVTIGLVDPEVINNFCRERLNARAVHFLNWEDVADIQKHGHEIGSHSFQHLDLGLMSRSEVSEDLSQAKVVLEQYCGEIIHFAFPYGGIENFSEEALDECFNLGHKSCASAKRGCYLGGGNVDLSQNLILRDQLILAWPIGHILFFLSRNLRRAILDSTL